MGHTVPENSSSPFILAVSGDPGGARTIAPVVKLLRDQSMNVRVLALASSQKVWSDCHHPCELLPQPLTLDFALNPLSGVSLVLTGTSSAPVDCEKKFITAARLKGVPSLAVIDFWSNYTERFSDEQGRLTHLPDRIAVMDAWARDEMIAIGFPPDRLVITGQPAFDELAMWQTKTSPSQRQAVRDLWKVRAEDWLVLFASQPFSLLFGTDATSPRYLGFDEQSVLRQLISALEAISIERQKKITLAVRRHAKENTDGLKKIASSTVRVCVAKEQSPYDLALASDLVVGMTSTLLIEACYLGCVVVSLQPNLRMPDKFPMSRWKCGSTIYRADQIKSTLQEALLNESVRASMVGPLSNLQLDGQAANRVAKLACELMAHMR